MITLYIGNIGSGKTLTAVREMATNQDITYHTNINTTLKNCVPLTWDKIILTEVTGTKNKRDGTVEEIKEHKLNSEYWLKAKKPLSIVLDEAHNVLDARRSTSKKSIIMNNFGSLIRKFMGDDEKSEIILITQLSRRLDIVWKEMAHEIRYFTCYYNIICSKCSATWPSDSDNPIRYKRCLLCGSLDLKKIDHVIEVKLFAGLDAYYDWHFEKKNSFYNNYAIKDVNNYFKYYNTKQIENLLSDL